MKLHSEKVLARWNDELYRKIVLFVKNEQPSNPKVSNQENENYYYWEDYIVRMKSYD